MYVLNAVEKDYFQYRSTGVYVKKKTNNNIANS